MRATRRKAHDVAVTCIALGEVVQGLDEEVDPFIAVLIAPAERDEEGACRIDVLPVEARSHGTEEAA